MIKRIKRKLQNNLFVLSQHAENEKQNDMIKYSEIDEAFEDLELIEDYPDDSRGHSCLLLGVTKKEKPLHFVCGNLKEEKILLITMYRPKADKWINFKRRRK